MIRLDLPYHRKARVWTDDMPPAFFKAEQTLEHRLPASKQASFETRRVVVELLAPKGAHMDYGLLGAELRSAATSELEVLVNTALSLILPLPDSLMPAALDEVRIGLPLSYAEAVIDGVTFVADEMDELLTGKLHFQYAAHGVISSSAAMFKDLGLTVVRLLMMDVIPGDKKGLLPFLMLQR